MIVMLKALEAEGPASQDERIGCKIWENFEAITQRNTENVVHLI